MHVDDNANDFAGYPLAVETKDAEQDFVENGALYSRVAAQQKVEMVRLVDEEAHNSSYCATPAIRAETQPKVEMAKLVDEEAQNNSHRVTSAIRAETQPKVEMVRLVDEEAQNNSHRVTSAIRAETQPKVEMVKLVRDENIILPQNSPINRDVFRTQSMVADRCMFGSTDVVLLPIPNTNACMAVVEVVDGEFPRYKCLISVNNGPTREISIPVARFTDGKWLKDIPCLGIVGGPKSTTIICDYLNQYIMNYQGAVSSEIKKPGWSMFQDKLVYVTPNGVWGNKNIPFCSSHGQKFPEILPTDRVGDIKEFLEIGRVTRTNPAATIISLYVVISFLATLYKSVELPVKFSLFLHGPRGSLKTSLALALTQIEDRYTPKYTLRATCAGIEAGFKRYKDAVMLIDDLCPTQDPAEQRALQHNLEKVRRCFGDATGDLRNTEWCDKKRDQYVAEGGAIITGEYVTGVASSLARSLLLPIATGDVDIELLSRIQSDNKLLARFLFGFFEYLEKNMEQKLLFISQRCKQYRASKEGLYSNNRYGEYFGHLMTASDLLLQYGYETGQLTSEEVQFFKTLHLSQVSSVIDRNSTELKQEEPITHMCNAIIEGIENGPYSLVELGCKHELHENLIMEDSNYYYIPQPLLKNMKEAYDKKHGIITTVLTSSSKYISDLLYTNNVIEQFSEGNAKRYGKKITGYGHTRYVFLKKCELTQFSII